MSPSLAPPDLQAFVLGLLEAAVPYVRSHFGRTGPLAFKEGRQAVTEVDREVEDRLCRLILGAYPDHGIDGEEGGARGNGDSPWRWHVDPIDGTFNYSIGIPSFSISVTVSHEGEVLAAGVADPLRDEYFTAARGEGAFLGGQPIGVSDRTPLREALGSFQLGKSGVFVREPQLLQRLHREVMKSRCLGTIALELAYVACGRFDLLLAGKSVPQNLYDIAAGVLLVQEAGGRVSDGYGGELRPDSIQLLVSNGHVHDELVALIAPYLAPSPAPGP